MEKWQGDMLVYLSNRWAEGNPHVILYLLGGHQVEGDLDLGENLPDLEEATEEATEEFHRIIAEAQSEIMESGDVCLKVRGCYFNTHVSAIVAYTVIDSE